MADKGVTGDALEAETGVEEVEATGLRVSCGNSDDKLQKGGKVLMENRGVGGGG